MLKRLTAVLAIALFVTGMAGVFYTSDSNDAPADSPTDPPEVEPVNAVIGDMSYVKRFGHPPSASVREDVRIQTHLAYVEQLLRARPTDHLSPEQQAARTRHLDRLRQYWMQARFPHNDDPTSNGRQPTFIDSDGRICAVGYLIAESAGWDVAERINAEYKYAYIEDIDAPMLDEWAERAGFTRHELAMIQPQYGDDGCVGCVGEDEEKMARGVEIGGMAVNAGAAVLNGVLSTRGQRSYVASGAGLALGATGLAMGFSNRANYSTGDAVFAGASLLMSAWNLAAPLQRRASSSASKSSASTTEAWIPDTHVAALPDRDATPKMGLSLRWTF